MGSGRFQVAVVAVVALLAGEANGTCPDGKTYPIALTFDDGPVPGLTNRTLDVLDRHDVPATFFVMGDKFATEAQRRLLKPILQRMKDEGHRIGSHTWSHVQNTKLSEEKARENITRSRTVIGEFLEPILRLPYGDGSFPTSNPAKREANARVMRLIAEAGFTHVGWRIDTNDWDPSKRATLLPKLKSDICAFKGGVVLFHDVQRNTVENLDAWITAIKEEGHTIVDLAEFVPSLSTPVATVSGTDCDETPDPLSATVGDLAAILGAQP